MFTEQIVKSPRWRKELNRILKSVDPTNGERLFFCCFCKDKLGWDESHTCNFINDNCTWSNYDRSKTIRHVNMVFERKAQGILISKSQASCVHSSTVLDETHYRGNTPAGQSLKVETHRVTAVEKNVENFSFVSGVFRVSPNERASAWADLRIPEEQKTGSEESMEQRKPLEIKQVFGTIDNGTKFYRVVEKMGEKGSFISLESGFMVDATTASGEQVNAFGRPDKYFSLPRDQVTMTKLIEVLSKVYDGGSANIAGKKKK